MNKMTKLMMVGALMAQVGVSWGMEEEPLAVRNESGMTLDLKWTYVGPKEDVTRRTALMPGEDFELFTLEDECLSFSQIVEIRFQAGWGVLHVWDNAKIRAKAKAEVIAITLADVLAPEEMASKGAPSPERPRARVAGMRISEVESQAGAVLLNWFPRMKNKLLNRFGEDEIVQSNLEQLNQLIELAKQPGLSYRDILNLSENYTADEVIDKAASFIESMNQVTPKEKRAAAIAKRLVEWAKQEALRQLGK